MIASMENPTRLQPSPPLPQSLPGIDLRTCTRALPARNGYEIRFTNSTDALMAQANQLVERMYRARGLLHYNGKDGSNFAPWMTPRQHSITVAACKAHSVAATLTLSLDTGTGLLADALYRDIIDRTRKKDARVCEITRLAIDPDHESRDLMVSMLQSLYVLARLIYRITDVFIEVHPRHANFYARKLGYRLIGPERTCARVGAPAVLMHLCESELEQLLDAHAGVHPAASLSSISSSLYQQFDARGDLERLGEHLRELLFGLPGLRTSA